MFLATSVAICFVAASVISVADSAISCKDHSDCYKSNYKQSSISGFKSWNTGCQCKDGVCQIEAVTSGGNKWNECYKDGSEPADSGSKVVELKSAKKTEVKAEKEDDADDKDEGDSDDKEAEE